MTKQKRIKTVGIIGSGGIGKALEARLLEAGYTVTFILTQHEARTAHGTLIENVKTLKSLAKTHPKLLPDVFCLCIPTIDTGEAAFAYIRESAELGIPLVTCEKGALSYHADKIVPRIKSGEWSVRYSASVGGGTLMIPYLQQRHSNERAVEIQTVINGTCNFIFHQTAQGGRTLGEACDEAVRLGYAEPGATDPLSLLNGELHDVRMKTCVFFNTTLAAKIFITPTDLGALSLTETSLEMLSRNSGQYRLVISFSNSHNAHHYDFVGSHFVTNVDGWNIQGGFRDIQKDPELATWLPPGVGNAIHITEGKLGSGGRYTLTGPGAGHEPTTTTILNDIRSLEWK